MTTSQITGVERIEEGTERHGFGVVDRKGREIGASVRQWVQIVEPGAQAWGRGGYLEAGTHYAVLSLATRGGVPYGASQRTTYCRTEQERAALIEKYLAGARKRAAKTAGK